jgi:vesicle coat complex subunit
VADLRAKLNDIDPDVKQDAIRKIIDAMTRGKDVSMLFMDVVKNM